MANTKEIKRKINSIKDIGTITKAMELVSTSKVKYYRDKMFENRPYAEGLLNLLDKFVFSSSSVQKSDGAEIFFSRRVAKKVLYVVFSTDRGLCSALNYNLFKMIDQHRKSFEMDAEIIFLPVGEKASRKYKNENIMPKSVVNHRPTLNDFVQKSEKLVNAFLAGAVDEVYLCYNKYINSMLQEPRIVDLLPISNLSTNHDHKGRPKLEFSFETDENELLLSLGMRYLEFMFYQANMENLTCEQVARILAMQNATENVGNMVSSLNTTYHKARQAMITQEISEIIGGASVE